MTEHEHEFQERWDGSVYCDCGMEWQQWLDELEAAE